MKDQDAIKHILKELGIKNHIMDNDIPDNHRTTIFAAEGSEGEVL